MKLLNWQFCKDPNDVNIAIEKQDEDWYGLKNAEQIVSVSYDTNHGCYVVFWVFERKKQMDKYINTELVKRLVLESEHNLMQKIFELPSADVVEVKHGKWAEAHDTSGHDYQRCTACGVYIEDIFFANDYSVNFCPQCGADMRERRETE